MAKIIISAFLCLAMFGSLALGSPECPTPNGRFAAGDQCDAYTECQDDVPVEKLCPDGLLFHQRTKTTGECTYAPYSTCKERSRLQPANGTDECPRQFGFYPNGDETKCGVYRNCAHGVASLTKCPEGLAFNEETYQCDWPDLVANCNAEAYLGFNCPAPELVDGVAPEVDVSPEGELRYYRHPQTCKKYFVCVNGHPRLYNCGKYLAFNAQSKLCDFYSKVPECYALLKEKQKLKAERKLPALEKALV
ncbi:protein obstructor-E isoform X1 [Drosophila hydei]|uniref:Protein obstructor-E isoform X1 n=1 Tax=Drosophila hydei TaxID=7224 RepID=A0A6J1MD92_DROHY|nr:protein obstructor-E isoform X1 [Drosophila hydei]